MEEQTISRQARTITNKNTNENNNDIINKTKTLTQQQ